MRALITPQAGRTTSAAGLALTGAILVAGCAVAEAPSCEVGEPLAVSLARWSDALRSPTASAGSSGYDPLLAELALAPLPEAGEGAPLELASLETMDVGRGGADAADVLVAARFRSADGAELLRAQLLRPLAGHDDAWCALGDELSRDKEAHEEPCLEPHDGAARELALEALVAPNRDAIVARDAGGWCGPGASRGDRFATSYWGVEGGRLVRYLEAVTFEAWYESPMPPVEIRRGELELSAGWPRAITLEETVECHEPDEPSAAATGCEPLAVTREHRYADGRYRAVGATPPTAAEPAGREMEETTP